jgi:hypothetical protein
MVDRLIIISLFTHHKLLLSHCKEGTIESLNSKTKYKRSKIRSYSLKHQFHQGLISKANKKIK